MRYTEYHDGESSYQRSAAASPGNGETDKDRGYDRIPEICCDEYCKYPQQCRTQEDMDQICDRCKLANLFDLLVDK